MRKRIIYYGAKLITEQIGSSDNYDKIQRVISIIITDENLIPNSPRYYHRFTYYDPVAGIELTNLREIHTLELRKLPDIADGTQLYDWAKFIDAETEEELEMVAKRNPQISRAAVKLRELSADERARDMFERREKGRRDIASIMEDAEKKINEQWQSVVAGKDSVIADKDAEIAGKDAEIAGKDAEIERLRAILCGKGA